MTDKVLHTIKCHQMIVPGDKVLIALSGGADSMALAFFLNEIKQDWRLSLEAVHVNHCLRGAEAERDARFVQAWCAAQGIPCHVVKRDVAAAAARLGISAEMAGRRVRYEVFASFGPDVKIATAHHLNDAMETVLFRLLRGTSMDGLTGIPPVRGNVIRPLIDCSRGEIEAYCAAHTVPYVTDSSNLHGAYTRNRIRNEIIPVMKGLNPALEDVFARFLTLVQKDVCYLEQQAQQAYEEALSDGVLDCAAVSALPEALRGRVICLYVKNEFGFTPEQKHVDMLEQVIRHGGRVQLSGDLTLKRFKNRLNRVFSVPNSQPAFEIVNKLVLSREEILNISQNDKNYFDFCGDYDKIRGNVLVRSRQPGDRITLAQRRCTKPLKKYFNELGILEEQRNRIPVLCDDVGLVGLAGIGCDARVQPCGDTRRFLLLKVKAGDKDEE